MSISFAHEGDKLLIEVIKLEGKLLALQKVRTIVYY